MKIQDLYRTNLSEAPARHDDEWADKAAGEFLPLNYQDIVDSEGTEYIDSVSGYDIYANRYEQTLYLMDGKTTIAGMEVFLNSYDSYSVMAIYTNPKFRKKGAALILYEYFLNNVGPLRTETPLTTGSVAIWLALSKKYYSYLVDPKNKKLHLVKDFSQYKEQWFDTDRENRHHAVLSATPL